MRGHCFINGKEKHVKCAYVGVNGKAQYIMKPPGVIKYGGSIERLSSKTSNFASAHIGNYAIFISSSTTSDAYDTKLTKITGPTHSGSGTDLAAATIGNYAIFLNGCYSKSVDAYDASLIRTSAPKMNENRGCTNGTAVGDYAIFAGGHNGTKSIATAVGYSSTLTMVNVASLSSNVMYLNAETAGGKYAIFCGRRTTVEAYDASLTKTTAASLGDSRYDMASATTINGYAIFAGGRNTSSSPTDVYNASLTRTSIGELTSPSNRYLLKGAAIGNYVIITGGDTSASGGPYDLVDVYNQNLSKIETNLILSTARFWHDMSVVGNYAILGGGSNRSYSSINTMEAFSYTDGYIP